MKKEVILRAILGIALFTVSIICFIHFSNDHAECENIMEYSFGENGEKIAIEKHICKERFNL